MIAIVNALLAMIRSLFKSRSALHVEILVLRHQLNVLGRGSCHRVHLRHLCLLKTSSIGGSLVISGPEAPGIIKFS
jgi:hypothetical protein